MYIIYALPKLKKEPPTTQKKDNKEKMKDQKGKTDCFKKLVLQNFMKQ